MSLNPPSSEEPLVSPIAPGTRRDSFPHRTSGAAPVKPFINTNTPAINDAPIELDGTPTSPDKVKAAKEAREGESGAFSPEDVLEELDGQKGGGSMAREKRAQLLAQRGKDPAVLVDIPQGPGAEELEVGFKDGMETPEISQGKFDEQKSKPEEVKPKSES